MTEATMRIGTTTKKRLVRAAAATAVAAAALLGMNATASATEQASSWTITGPTHTASSASAALAAAEADLPSLKAKCRSQGGTAIDSAVGGSDQAPYQAYAIVTCQPLR